MALGRARRSKGGFDYWPGFVDALSTMLLVIIFLLSVFMLAQYFLSREMTGKDTALQRLNRQIEELIRQRGLLVRGLAHPIIFSGSSRGGGNGDT